MKNKKQYFSLILLTSLCVKFLFGIGFVPSPSMYPTLMPGDIIYKDIISIGGTTPQIVLQVPGLSNIFPNFYSTWIQLPSFRARPAGTITRGDIIIFKSPTETLPNGTPTPITKREEFVKRLTAKPGDTISIQQGLVYINGEEDFFNSKRQWVFVCYTPKEIAQTVLNATQKTTKKKIKSGWQYHLTMTKAQYQQFCHNTYGHVLTLFESPNSTKYENEMPAYIVPYKGYEIALDKDTLPLYIKTLENKYRERFRTIQNKDGSLSFYLDGQQKHHYTFEEDYYFMKGDNTHESSDSTQFGFVATSLLIAKARVIIGSLGNPEHKLWSLLTFNWRGNRWIKKLA